MESAIETTEYRDYKIEVHLDQYPESPREWDNLGTMVCWHGRYDLGDKHDFASPQDFQEWAESQNIVILALYLYDHGIVGMSTESFVGRALHAEWDSGQVGYIYVTAEKLCKEYQKQRVSRKLREHAAEVLKGEVSTYNDFLSGAVYAYVLRDPNGEVAASCYGFYGDHSDMVSEVKGVVDFMIQQSEHKAWELRQAQLRTHAEQVKAWIRHKVPLSARHPCAVQT